MDQLQPFRDEALRRGIAADEVERWIATARPRVTLQTSAGPDARIAGQLGGHPLLPDDVPHPELSFAASLDCAAVPPGATDLELPVDGTLLFFIEPDFGDEEEDHRVVYVPAGTPVTERPPPSEHVVVFPRGDAHLVTDLTLPVRAGNDTDHPHAADLAEVWCMILDEILTGDGPVEIGGYPFEDQGSPFESAAKGAGNRPADWGLICSWAPETYDEYYCAEIQLVIRRDDLAARRFDRLHSVYQQVG